MKFFQKNGIWIIAAAAILIGTVSLLLLRNEEPQQQIKLAIPAISSKSPIRLTPEPTSPLAAAATQIPEPAPASAPATPVPTFSTEAAEKLPQDELLYTLPEVTPDPTPELIDPSQPIRTQISRNDSPDMSEELENLTSFVRQTLPGVWVGEYESITWRFWLDRDGNYMLSVGEEEETGKFSMTHQMEAFHTTLHLMPDDEGKAPYDLQICLASSDGEICLVPKNSSFPSFYREGVS